MQPVVINCEGGPLVVGTHDRGTAIAALLADPATFEFVHDGEDRGLDPRTTLRAEWLEPTDDYDYPDWFVVPAGTPGAVPVLIAD